MNWIFLALLAPFVYAVNIFLDKYIVSARLPDYRSLPIFGMLISLPVAVVLFVVSGFELTYGALLIILSGVLTIWAFSLYLEALTTEETSLLIVVIQLIPVIVLVMSYIFLGEVITFKQFLGFFLLLTSSILISVKKGKSGLGFSKPLVFILAADFIWAASYILIKLASEDGLSTSELVMYESAGVVLGGICLLMFVSVVRQAFFKTIKKLKIIDLSLILINESLYLGAKILTYIAVSLGPVALVSILGSTQIFYGILLGVVLTILLPKAFKENISREGLYKKVILGVLAFVGIILVS